MKVKLTKIGRYTENKDGEPYISKKTGKPFTICRIWTEEHGDKAIGGFSNQTNSDWKEGDEVEVIIKENGQWLNFETPIDKITRKEFDALILRVELLEKRLGTKPDEYRADAISTEQMQPQDEGDLPF